MKRFFALLLALLSLGSLVVFGDESTVYTQDGFQYQLAEYPNIYTGATQTVAYIVGYQGACPADLAIPQALGGHPVEAVLDNAFENRGEIVSVRFPETLKELRGYAFKNCDGLKTIVFHPRADLRLSYGVFEDCSALESVEVPYGVRSLGDYTFKNCQALREVSLPETLQENVATAFSNCPNLGYQSHGGVKYLGNKQNPFCIAVGIDNVAVSQVSLHEDCKVLNYSLFAGCNALKKVELPQGLLTIQAYAFVGCSSLKELDIPDSVTYMGFDPLPFSQPAQHWTLPSGLRKLGSISNVIEPFSYLFNTYENGLYLGTKDNPYYALVSGTPDKNGKFKAHPDTKILADKALMERRIRTLSLPEGLLSLGNYAIDFNNLDENYKLPKTVLCAGTGAFEFHTEEHYELADGHYEGCFCRRYAQALTAHGQTQGGTCVQKAACKDCGARVGALNPSEHGKTQLKNAKDPTCTQTGYTGDMVCADCKKTVKTGDILPVIAHADKDGAYDRDANGHFYLCACGVEFDRQAHSFAPDAAQGRVCTVCGYEEAASVTTLPPASSLPVSVGTTAAPGSTQAPGTTQAPGSAAVSSTAPLTSTPAGGAQGGFPWWIVVVVGLLALAGGAVPLALKRKRK